MKDYIYVDSDLATSYFAQINQGIISKILSNTTTSDTGVNNGGAEVTKEVKGSIGFAESKYSKKEVDTFSQAFFKSNSETTENVLHDYLIDILIEQIEPKKDDEFIEGDFVLIKNQIEIFDFKTIKEAVSVKMFENLYSFDSDIKIMQKSIKELSGIKNKTRDQIVYLKKLQKQLDDHTDLSSIEDAEKAMNIFESLFPDSILIKIGNTFSICNKQNFRLPSSSLMPFSLVKRSATMFATVISKVKNEDTIMPGDMLGVLSKAGSIIPELLLSTLEIKKDGDYNLRPIAIYFE